MRRSARTRARRGVTAAGWDGTVEFRVGRVDALDPAETFDAVVRRWVLMFQADPVAVVRGLANLVRPAGSSPSSGWPSG